LFIPVPFHPSGGTDYEEINDVVFSLQPMSVNGDQLCIPIETLSDGDNTEPAESFFVQAIFEDGVDPASATATVDIGGEQAHDHLSRILLSKKPILYVVW
jgi:hypothetical protein